MRREPLVYPEEPKTLIALKFKECVKESDNNYALGNLDTLVAEFVKMGKETNEKAAVYLTLLADMFQDPTRRLYIPNAGFSTPECLDVDYAEADLIAAELRRIAADL